MTPEERKAKRDKERDETVTRHITELREMAADGIITDEEHDLIGHTIEQTIAKLIGLSKPGWIMFKRIIEESRRVHYGVDAAIQQKAARERLQEVAQEIDKRLPEGYGFFLLCFPMNQPAGAAGEYVSNARRENVLVVMRDFIERNPMPKIGDS